MNVCRLCGLEKEAGELVMSLTEPCGVIKLKDYVEFYCRIQLSSEPEYPQKICQSCSNVIAKFGEFSFQVEQQQKKFDLMIKPNNKASNDTESEENESVVIALETDDLLVEISDDDEDPEELVKSCSVDEDITWFPEEFQQEQFDPYVFSSLEPPIQDQSSNTYNTLSSAKKEAITNKSLSKDNKCQRKTIKVCLLEINSLFGTLTADVVQSFKHIEVSSFTNLENGEVAIHSNKTTMTSWEEVQFRCNCSCERIYKGFLSLMDHLTIVNKYNVSCITCNKVSCGDNATTSIINHTCRHFEFLKFCCLICSKYYFNIISLSNHYICEHPDLPMKIYPCLVCGLYCQSPHHLRMHRKCHGNLYKSPQAHLK